MASQVKRLVIKAALRVINLEDLKVDPSYQREVKRGHSKIVTDFNEEALGVPVVAERDDGTLWIVDGQQRITAIRTLGWTTVRAEVFASRGPEHEASVFKLINLNRIRLTPIEQYRALLTAHDETAWKVKEAVESCGFKIVRGQAGDVDATPYIQAINVLMREATEYGVEAIKLGLVAIRDCWPGDPAGLNNNILAGMFLFFRRNNNVVDTDRLYPRLKQTTPQKILFTARQLVGGNNLFGSVADTLERVYRRRLRG